MQRIFIRDCHPLVGSTVLIRGWVDSKRDMGKVVFIDVRDLSGTLQTVFVESALKEGKDELKTLHPQTVIECEGVVQARGSKQVNTAVKNGDRELLVTHLRVLAKSENPPFNIEDELSLDVFLDHLPLTLRSSKSRAIFKVQAEIVEGFRAFMRSRDFVEFQAPKLVAMATEGGSNVFRVDYFDHDAYLAQSPQFYKQIMVGIFERVFTIGNVYRAEPHATSRHVNEYTSMDFEFGFINDHRDVMKMETELLIYLMDHLRKTVSDEFAMLLATLPQVPSEIPSYTLREAQKLLKEHYGEDCLQEPDLEPHHEVKICEYVQKQHNSEFVFITHFPTAKRPFYTHPDPENPEYTRGFDLLFRGIEITTGGQRIHDYQRLQENIRKWKLDPKVFEYYAMAFQYGMPPEGGLAIGLERLTAKLLGMDNVKKATLFPRDLNRIDIKLSDFFGEKGK